MKNDVATLDEKKLSAILYKFVEEGRQSRLNGTQNNYNADTVGHTLSIVGWVYEDLRLALMRKDESYCHGQALTEKRDQ